MDDPFDLERFVRAQSSVYSQALSELRAGCKRSHWMWFVFPQMRGLGSSSTAHQYGISGRQEGKAYLAHDILGPRLRDSVSAVLGHGGMSALDIFGFPDDLKFRSSMTLFAELGEPNDPFRSALYAFFGGEPDPRTLDLLR